MTTTETIATLTTIGARQAQAVADLLDTYRDIADPVSVMIGTYTAPISGMYVVLRFTDTRHVAMWAQDLGTDVHVYPAHVSAGGSVHVDGHDIDVTVTAAIVDERT